MQLRIKHKGELTTLELRAGADACAELGSRFNIPPDRIKIIHRGKQLRGSRAEVWAALEAAEGDILQVMGTATEDQLPPEPGVLRRSYRAIADAVAGFSLALVWSWVSWFGRTTGSFFASMLVRRGPAVEDRRHQD